MNLFLKTEIAMLKVMFWLRVWGCVMIAADGIRDGERVSPKAEEAAGFPGGLNPCTEAKLSRTLLPSSPQL